MTSTEYDRSRLEALPAAVKILDKIRWDLCTDNRPAWNLLYDAAEHTKKQNAAEWQAYFTPQPDPEPPASSLSEFRATYLANLVKDRADAIRNPEPTLSPIVDYITSSPATKAEARPTPLQRIMHARNAWYTDLVPVYSAATHDAARLVAGLISDHGINASAKNTPDESGRYPVAVHSADERRALRCLDTPESLETLTRWFGPPEKERPITSSPATTDAACVVSCVTQDEANRLARKLESLMPVNVHTTPGNRYGVYVSQADEARANRTLALTEGGSR